MLDGVTWRLRLGEAKTLLDREHKLLLAGAIDELARLDRKRAAVEAHILRLPADIAETHANLVNDVRRRALRNQRVLKAFIQGARQAAARIRAIDRENTKLGAYKQDGTLIEGAEERTTRGLKA